MKLRSSFKVAAKANMATGAADIELAEHFKATNQEHLPQAQILTEVLDLLKSKGLIEEAYLRGSLGRGHGDVHSDIDLFTVVRPENIGKAYDAVDEYLREKGSVITSCYDRLVADYGGIGFEFVATNKEHDKTFQFDLYFAIQGVAPIMDFYIKPRVYSRDPNYSWMKEYGTPRDLEGLPQVTKDFIQKYTEGEDVGSRMELLVQEQLLNIFITSKHMKRGQTSRMLVDNNAIIACAVEMMQALTGYSSNGYSPTYLGNEVVKICRDHGDDEMVVAADRLEKFFDQKMDAQKLRDLLVYCRDILFQAFPERYEGQKEAFAFFEKELDKMTKPAASKNNNNKPGI